MPVPAIARAKQWLRRRSNRIFPGALILLYHRVTRLESDPQWLAVSAAHFEQHLEVLNRNRWHIFALPDLASTFSDYPSQKFIKPPHRAVAITFDDGYADNLTIAKPLLERHAAHATIFVTAGFIESGEEFYWDELERLLLTADATAATLTVAQRSWDLEPLDGASAPTWNVLSPQAPSERHEAYRELCRMLTDMSDARRREVLAAIRDQTGAGVRHAGRESHRVMTRDEVRRSADSGLIEIGAHTLTHPRLAALPLDQQRREITQSKQLLEQIIDGPVLTFSYPYGNHGDYSPDTIQAVRQAGFEYACSNFGGSVRVGAPALELNRVLVRDWDGDEFERRVRGWFDE